ncbi:hypothetical protein M378DRAFT_77370 [Amanita muscaria Koide BX008]|uniref:Aminoglycoside phosphotransferase domain-containing protein n=1 Tax=Amanita muscaria (strain Koide BX008) TaxID=946122 RepID=A0A0C2SPC9_AMAMK|nr:hypothetical protein M378DRAFT_77370 [Amanita muscaria Koide BX008]
MPTSPPCSQPVKLLSVSAVEAFLAGTPFASRSITVLPGGTVNYLYRIQLLTPFEGSQTVVLKHAQPFWKSSMSTAWEVERQMFEVEAMTRIRPWLSSTLPVKVPKIHHFDAHNNVIIMEDCGADAVTLREFLCSGSASSTGLAETIGAAIGKFIALVHEWSRSNPDGILDVFEKSLQAKKTIACLNYDRIVATLQRADKDDLTVLSGFKVDPSDIQVISKLTDEYRSLLMSARIPGREVFLMGDLWHENILLNANEHPLRLYILDWELARIGLPGSEVGLFCAYTDLLGRANQVAYKPASVMLQNFIEAYSRISNRDMRLAQDTLVHWGINYVFWAPRGPPGDRKLVQDFVREGVEILVHFGDKDFLAQSSVKGLLPK